MQRPEVCGSFCNSALEYNGIHERAQQPNLSSVDPSVPSRDSHGSHPPLPQLHLRGNPTTADIIAASSLRPAPGPAHSTTPTPGDVTSRVHGPSSRDPEPTPAGPRSVDPAPLSCLHPRALVTRVRRTLKALSVSGRHGFMDPRCGVGICPGQPIMHGAPCLSCADAVSPAPRHEDAGTAHDA
ncbi:hypothetical protein CC85DRAFT_84377 [Cutaneotrichosporon oleaginosum]|uniref:Uncharacterized protein n=1 Tax=Cutaneotrichosporon oleaginosum TaxID=879819 RepID=A0A0J0XNB7_9TREE|nr:uncharacterized protein CC85DRAFT_84377 [Cutaneotrichosporon oleaginosum]KLT42573.1 hypothetical protein CC85DRAFT_84377 [Cutaneotrichosporon oleaginosum]TXT15011.1 hypothetical protein COLE_01204 [Cutaneotrichosporon oleaginosum]